MDTLQQTLGNEIAPQAPWLEGNQVPEIGARLRRAFFILGNARFWIGLLLLAMVASGIWLVWRAPNGTPGELGKAHGELVSLVAGQRIHEGRLTGFDVHAPCEEDESRCLPLPGPESRQMEELEAVERDLWQAMEEEPGVASQHAFGLGQLFQARDGGEVAEAINTLEGLVAEDVQNANLLSDLAAAYLLQAHHEDDPRALARAFEAADQALEVDSKHSASAFNRALALSQLHVPIATERAWDLALKLEADPAWQQEILQRKEHLQSAESDWLEIANQLSDQLPTWDRQELSDLAVDHGEQLITWAEGPLFSLWMDHILVGGGDAEALEWLESVAEATGDTLLQATESAIRQAPEAELAMLHREYEELKARYAQKQDLEALRQSFASIAQRFGRLGSPYELWSRYFGAICSYFLGEQTQALQSFEMMRLDGAAHPRFQAQVDWMIGLIQASQGRYGLGIDAYRAAAGGFSATAMKSRAALMRTLLAEVYRTLGDLALAWDTLYPNLQHHGEATTATARRVACVEAAQVLAELGYFRLAAVYLEDALDAARREDAAAAVAEVLYARARLEHQSGQKARAIESLAEAREWLAAIEEPEIARLVESRILQVEGLVGVDSWSGEDPLGEAIAYCTEVGLETFLPELFYQRGTLALSEGRTDAAEADFLKGAELSLTQRRQLPSAQWRASLATVHRRLVEGLIRLRLDAQRPSEEILPWVEVLQAASSASPEGHQVDFEASLGELPKGVAVVSYTYLEEEILAWTYHAGRVELQRLSVEVGRLQQALKRARQLHQPRGFTAPARRELFEWLVEPLLSNIGQASTWILVVDKLLEPLPFAALEDSRTGRFLVENHGLIFAPSESLASSTGCRQVPDQLLVVGEPFLSATRREVLGDLPQAREEAVHLAASTSPSVLLLGEDATSSAVLHELNQATSFHFAGHALASPGDPEASRLVLAGDTARRPAGLFGVEIRELDLCHLDLVVLSACRTANTDGGPAAFSLALSFLSAGARGVVASVSDIEDRLAAELMAEFYRELETGIPTAEALRRVQRRALEDSARSTTEWASLRFITAHRGDS